MISRIFRTSPSMDPVPTLANVAYRSECSRQKLDFWASTRGNATPKPALIFFHGGAFVSGSKFYCQQMREVQERGAVAIAVNYRFVRKQSSTIAHPMEDSMSAFNFVLENADRWNIDRNRIALHGKSAGGCLALWLGMNAPVRGITTYNTPTTIDPEYLVQIGKRRIEAFWPVWGPMSGHYLPAGLKTQRVQQLIKDYSPLNQAHASSPPIYLHYTADEPPHRIGWRQALHSVRYGELMKERYSELGLSCELASPSSPPNRTPLEFLCKVLGLPAEPLMAT